MERALRQRLIGASVLVAVGVIVIPMLLDSDTAPPTEPIQIPPRPADLGSAPVFRLEDEAWPATDGLSVPLPEPLDQETATASEALSDPGTSVRPKQGSADEPRDMPPIALAPGDSAHDQPAAEPPRAAGVPAGPRAAPSQERLGVTAFAIQLGSFSSEANAKALESKLKDRGYRAFVEKIYINTGSVFRVRVGPEIEEAKAKALLARLESEISLKGILVRYP
jgi:DedD protein